MNTDSKEMFGEDLFEAAPKTDESPQTRKSIKTLDQWKMRYTDFASVMSDARRKALRNYKYYNGDQLTNAERETLNTRGQPDVVINRMRVAVNGIMGVVRHSATQPIALPVRPSDEDASDVATESIRYAMRKNKFKSSRIRCLKDYLLGGVTAILVGVKADRNIDLIKLRWEEFFFDPRSREEDFSDARYMGFARWMYSDELKEINEDPEMHRRLDEAVTQGVVAGGGMGFDEVSEDRPIDQGWLDTKTKRVLVVEIYERVKGVWYRCQFWDGGILMEEESPYKCPEGRPCNPIVAHSCYVTTENERQGYAVDLLDIQDEINKRRSKALWEITATQIQAADPSAIEVDADIARKEASRPDGVIPYGWQTVRGTDKTAGNMALLNEAKNEMERFSPNPAMLGRQGSDTSGKALLARQQAGLVELGVVLGQFEDFELAVGEAIWSRIRQFWTGPMVIRLTDDPLDLQFLEINKPVQPTPEQPMLDEAGEPVIGSDGQPVMIPATEGDELGYTNRVAELDVDIMIETAVDTATIREAQLAEIRQILATNPAYADQIPFEVIIDLTNLPRKREIMKKIRKHREEAQQAAAQQAEEDKAIRDATLKSELGKMDSETQRNIMEGRAKMMSAQQGEIRTAVQADKTLAGIDNDATRIQMEGAKTTAEIIEKATNPAAEVTGDVGPPSE